MDRKQELEDLIAQQEADHEDFIAVFKKRMENYGGARNSFARHTPSHGPRALHDGSNDPLGEDTW